MSIRYSQAKKIIDSGQTFTDAVRMVIEKRAKHFLAKYYVNYAEKYKTRAEKYKTLLEQHNRLS